MKNKAKEFSVDNMVLKYKTDMARLRKQDKKMNERDDIDYKDVDDTESDDDVAEGDSVINRIAKTDEDKQFVKYLKEKQRKLNKEFDDSPYEVEKEEENHLARQEQELSEQIDDLKPDHQKHAD